MIFHDPMRRRSNVPWNAASSNSYNPYADDIRSLGTIMGIWAHPDDETYLAGGILASAVRNGQNVVCVTATKGEAGSTSDPAKWPLEKMGEIREGELADALEILGVTNQHYLGCKDGLCIDESPEAVVAQITELINQYKPDTILTFGPEGWSGHPDHQQVSAWASAAVLQSRSSARIFHVAHTQEQYDNYLQQLDRTLNFFFNIEKPPIVPREQCAIYYTLPKEIVELKCRALAAMLSQTGRMFELFAEDFIASAVGIEMFITAPD